MTDLCWYRLNAPGRANVDMNLVWHSMLLMLFIIGKGVFVKSYVQPESHSHVIDIVTYKMSIFARVRCV